MGNALRADDILTPPMTVEEFREWSERQPDKWELVDGFPRPKAQASSTHAFIQARAAFLIERHLDGTGSRCRPATEPPVVPEAFRRHNARFPDLVVTCAPPDEDDYALNDPVFVMEILSPFNPRETRNNVWLYMSIASIRQILLIDSTRIRGEMLARRPDGSWPDEPAILGPDDVVSIEAMGFACPLREFYARTRLAE